MMYTLLMVIIECYGCSKNNFAYVLNTHYIIPEHFVSVLFRFVEMSRSHMFREKSKINVVDDINKLIKHASTLK